VSKHCRNAIHVSIGKKGDWQQLVACCNLKVTFLLTMAFTKLSLWTTVSLKVQYGNSIPLHSLADNSTSFHTEKHPLVSSYQITHMPIHPRVNCFELFYYFCFLYYGISGQTVQNNKETFTHVTGFVQTLGTCSWKVYKIFKNFYTANKMFRCQFNVLFLQPKYIKILFSIRENKVFM